MPHFYFRNVNEAFSEIVANFEEPEFKTIRTTSRVGDVIQAVNPITITYSHPCERVLFNQARDANPFFHLMEALWMLAGFNDVRRMEFYNSNIGKIASDDNKTFNGAYGFRWRHYNADLGDTFDEVDQLELIIQHLRNKPDSRRTVLQMWSPTADLPKVGIPYGKPITKDVCCNTQAYFLIIDGKLDMTVCNRSNDLIWGMLGANVVHFSILQEYLAGHLGIPVGRYHHFTNNLHVYTERWEPEKWMSDTGTDRYALSTNKPLNFPLVHDCARFDKEVFTFVQMVVGDSQPFYRDYDVIFYEPFIKGTALPMALAFASYKLGRFGDAMNFIQRIVAEDWRIAAYNWILVRKQKREQKESSDGSSRNGVDAGSVRQGSSEG